MVATTGISIRTKKFMNNPLLCRKQMVLQISHPGKASVSKKDIQEKLAEIFGTSSKCVVCHKMMIKFGGGCSTGLAMIYDSVDMLKKFEPKYRQIRNGLVTKSKVTRRMKKDIKHRVKRARGVAKTLAATQGTGKK